jgi:hypothetical protein
MSLLCWNCQGLGNLWIIQELQSLVKNKKPHFLFLIETKVKVGVLQRLRYSLGFGGLLQVDPIGRSGGLAFYWKSETDVEILNYSQRHISASINLVQSNDVWTFTGFYGHLARDLRESSWKLLSYLGSQSNSAWLCTYGRFQ